MFNVVNEMMVVFLGEHNSHTTKFNNLIRSQQQQSEKKPRPRYPVKFLPSIQQSETGHCIGRTLLPAHTVIWAPRPALSGRKPERSKMNPLMSQIHSRS